MRKYCVPTLCIALGALLSSAKWAESRDQRTDYPSAREIVKVAEMEQTQSIGTATMREDRTIVLDLIASGFSQQHSFRREESGSQHEFRRLSTRYRLGSGLRRGAAICMRHITEGRICLCLYGRHAHRRPSVAMKQRGEFDRHTTF